MKQWSPYLLVMLLLLTACEKLNELTVFDIQYDTSHTIPANSIVDTPINLISPEIETNAEEEFALNDTRADKIEEVRLKRLYMKITDPAEETFSFVKSVEIFLRADDLPEVLVAGKTDIPDDIGDELEMDTYGQDLADYVKKEKIQIRIKVITDELLSQDTKVDAFSTFEVDAKLL